MFAIKKINQKLEILEIEEVIRPNSNGRCTWILFKGWKKPKPISNSKIFKSKQEAESYLKERQEAKDKKTHNRQMKFEKEQKQIDEIMDDIFESFGVTVKFLSRPFTVEGAWDLYYKVKQNKRIRNIELY